MVNQQNENQSKEMIDLKEGNENSFGSVSFLNFIDQCTADLAQTLGLTAEVNSVVFDNLFTKEVTLDNQKPDNFTQVVIKYISAHFNGNRLNATRVNHTMLNLTNELSKLSKSLNANSAIKIEEFIRKLVFYKAEDITFDIEVESDDFYLSLIIYSSKELHSLRVEIF